VILILEKIRKKATAIGSMPYRSTTKALEIISRYLVHLPHWPQLPCRSPEEGFIKQYLNPMLEKELISINEGKVFFRDDRDDWDELLAGYYEEVLKSQDHQNGLETFAFPGEAAEGFYEFLKQPPVCSESLMVKGQVSGPVSIGLSITDSRGNPSFYQDQLRDITVKTLSLNAKWQVQKLQQLGLPVLVFVDDPGIYSYGTSSYVGLSKEAIQEGLKEINDSIKEVGGFSGVHACAGVDWAIPLELNLDIINFDAYEYFTSMMVYPELLSSFLEKGGLLAWGLVPTSASIEYEEVSSLVSSLQEKMETLSSKGIDLSRLKEQMLVTPSCGSGTLSEKQSEKVYQLTREVEKEIAR